MFVLILSAILYINYSTWSDVYAQNNGSRDDDTDPIISVPAGPVISEATGPQGSLVSYIVSATNATGSPLNVSCTPQSGSMFALGTSTVDCTTTDELGNDATASFEVLVQDTTPPTTELGVVKTDWMGLIVNNDFTNSDDIGFAFTGSDSSRCQGL